MGWFLNWFDALSVDKKVVLIVGSIVVVYYLYKIVFDTLKYGWHW